MVSEEGSGSMPMITLEAATPQSGRALYSALSPFDPELDTDDEGKCFVSVSVGSVREMLEVRDIQRHLVGGADSITSWVTTQHRPVPCPHRGGTGVRYEPERSQLVEASTGNSDRALREIGRESSIEVERAAFATS